MKVKHSNLILKILILIAVGSYFAYALYWFVATIPWIVEISVRSGDYVPATGLRSFDSLSMFLAYLMEYSSFLGLVVRVFGASYALLSVLPIFRDEKSFFLEIKNRISRALLLEGCHYLFFIPAILFMLPNISALPAISNLLLSIILVAQILLITPILINLAVKVKDYESDADKLLTIRWAGLSYMSFVIAMWITYVLKWGEMMAVDPLLFSTLLSVRILGFMNTVFVHSSAAIFAVIGVYLILKKHDIGRSVRFLGLSSVLISLHMIVYVIYVTLVGATWFIPLGELWLIPPIGLGLYLLLKTPEDTRF